MADFQFRPLSKRLSKAINSKAIELSLSKPLRHRIWYIMSEYNSVGLYHPIPGDNWTEKIYTDEAAYKALLKQYGKEKLEAFCGDEWVPVESLKEFVMGAKPWQVLDAIEVFLQEHTEDDTKFQLEINHVLQDEKCPWMIIDGHFIQNDSEFLAENVLKQTHELMHSNGFEGAIEEFTKARDELEEKDYKNAVLNACKAYESVLKTILNRNDSSSAKVLVNELKETPFYDELPDVLIPGFGDQVLMALPYIRNKIGGHGQGSEVVNVPRGLAEFSVNLAGTLINFLIKRHLELKPIEDSGGNGDIPF